MRLRRDKSWKNVGGKTLRYGAEGAKQFWDVLRQKREKVMFWGILFIAILAYWLGCKRTKIKFLELLMTVDRRWRESVFQQQLEGHYFVL